MTTMVKTTFYRNCQDLAFSSCLSSLFPAVLCRSFPWWLELQLPLAWTMTFSWHLDNQHSQHTEHSFYGCLEMFLLTELQTGFVFDLLIEFHVPLSWSRRIEWTQMRVTWGRRISETLITRWNPGCAANLHTNPIIRLFLAFAHLVDPMVLFPLAKQFDLPIWSESCISSD